MDKQEADKRIKEIEGELALLTPVTADGQPRHVEGDRQEIHRRWDELWAEKRGLQMVGSRTGRSMPRAREERRPPNRRRREE